MRLKPLRMPREWHSSQSVPHRYALIARARPNNSQNLQCALVLPLAGESAREEAGDALELAVPAEVDATVQQPLK